MSDFIGIDLQGDEEIIAILNKLPIEVQNHAVDEVSKYIINVVKTYPPRKSVSRREAYPNLSFVTASGKRIVGYKNIRQFRAVMAKVSQGQVPYKRTQTLRNNWKQYGTGTKSIIANETPYAGFVMGDGTQSRHSKLIGWQTLGDIIDKRKPTIIQKIHAGVQKAFRKLGLR